MEKYVENYFEKLKDFEENSSKFVVLRKKEANFVSLLSESLNDVLKGTDKLFGKKCVATVHGLDWQREKWGKGFASKYIKAGEKALAKYADFTAAGWSIGYS